MNKRYPKYATLVKALERRDSVKATLGVEGLPFQFPQHRYGKAPPCRTIDVALTFCRADEK